ncbi:DUF21 domain-containing protein [candidate division WOR-3 bacterium]|nr:DUF21 domain-containing protein [candidate division WOR-3 bacterium]
MTGEIAVLFLGVVFIFVQAFFAGSETAYVVANPVRVAHISRKTRRQEQAIELLNNPEALLVMTLICTNIAVVLSEFFFTTFFVSQFGEFWGTSAAIIVGAVSGLILGEYFPKNWARTRAEQFVVATSGFYRVAAILARPFRKVFRTPKAKERRGERLAITRPDILTALKLGEKIGSIEEKTSPRVANLFSAFDTPLADVMTPWDRVATLTSGYKRADVLMTVSREGFTRYPVLDKKTGKILGILHTKDLLIPRHKLREPFFTKPGVRITELLRTMQTNRAHMAIILDRDDQPTGLVTLEDLLEEFIGEIRSEE